MCDLEPTRKTTTSTSLRNVHQRSSTSQTIPHVHVATRPQLTLGQDAKAFVEQTGGQLHPQAVLANGETVDEQTLRILVKQAKISREGAPHTFQQKTFSTLTYCNLCGEFMWGITNQGFSCSICNYSVHKVCMRTQVPPRTCRLNCLPHLIGFPLPNEELENDAEELDQEEEDEISTGTEGDSTSFSDKLSLDDTDEEDSARTDIHLSSETSMSSDEEDADKEETTSNEDAFEAGDLIFPQTSSPSLQITPPSPAPSPLHLGRSPPTSGALSDSLTKGPETGVSPPTSEKSSKGIIASLLSFSSPVIKFATFGYIPGVSSSSKKNAAAAAAAHLASLEQPPSPEHHDIQSLEPSLSPPISPRGSSSSSQNTTNNITTAAAPSRSLPERAPELLPISSSPSSSSSSSSSSMQTLPAFHSHSQPSSEVKKEITSPGTTRKSASSSEIHTTPGSLPGLGSSSFNPLRRHRRRSSRSAFINKRRIHSAALGRILLSSSVDIELDETEDVNDLHHWVEGNTPFGLNCLVCHDPITSLGCQSHRCSRCSCVAHTTCLLTAPTSVCVPEHKRLMVGKKCWRTEYEADQDEYEIEEENQKLTNSGERFKDLEATPLLVFVNSKSGGQQGHFLIRKLRSLLNPSQVIDINLQGPGPALSTFRSVRNGRILVCGGDGTVGWVLSVLDQYDDWKPPVSVLPLGTGNDLARTLNWGAGYAEEKLSPILKQIEHAHIRHLDRWRISSYNLDSDGNAIGEPRVLIMNNYFSIGVDANVALAFHNLRNEIPALCSTRLGNKFWYLVNGVKSMFEKIPMIDQLIGVEIDGKECVLSENIGAIIFLNLPSYGGGADLWGKSKEDDGFQTPAIDDRMLELVAVTGSFQLGKIQVKMDKAIRLGQGSSIKIRFLKNQALPVQNDGEPWLQQPCEIHIQHIGQARLLSADPSPLSPAFEESEESTDLSNSFF